MDTLYMKVENLNVRQSQILEQLICSDNVNYYDTKYIILKMVFKNYVHRGPTCKINYIHCVSLF